MAVPAAKPPLSEHDYHAWLLEQAARLRARQFDQIDYEVLAEELEDMGRSAHPPYSFQRLCGEGKACVALLGDRRRIRD